MDDVEVGHLAVAAAAVHAHGRDEDAVAEVYAADREGLEDRVDFFCADAVLGIEECGAYGCRLLGGEVWYVGFLDAAEGRVVIIAIILGHGLMEMS